jgi:hypothetical protein
MIWGNLEPIILDYMLILLIMLINYDKVLLNLNFNCGENTDK